MRPEGSMNWSELLACALVAHSPLPLKATQALTAAFLQANVSELRVILAQGSQKELAIYPIITNGVINIHSMEAVGCLPSEKPTLVEKSMQQCAVIAVEASPDGPSTSDYADWQELRQLGCIWAYAAPLACNEVACGSSILGAVIAAGTGMPGLNPDWLSAWCCELSLSIAHCSLSVMESSLDMLRLIFPPKMVEYLIHRAVSSGAMGSGGAEGIEELLGAAATATTSTMPSNGNVADAMALSQPSSSIIPATRPTFAIEDASFAATSSERGVSGAFQDHLRVSSAAGSPILSPFAVFNATAPISNPSSTQNRSSSDSDKPSPSHRIAGTRSSSLPRSTSHQLAAAVLRQASLQSKPSVFFGESETSVSPCSSEVEGYEDLLCEDAMARASTKPSNCLEKALSNASMGSASFPSLSFPTEDSRGVTNTSNNYSNTNDSTGLSSSGTAGGIAGGSSSSMFGGISQEFPTQSGAGEGENAAQGSGSTTQSHHQIMALDGSGARGSPPPPSPRQQQQQQQQQQHVEITPDTADRHFHERDHVQQSHSRPFPSSTPLSGDGGGGDREPLMQTLSTISEGASGSQIDLSSIHSSRKNSAEQGLNLILEQDWNLAFSDARMENTFNRYVTPFLIGVDAKFGGISALLSALYAVLHTAFASAVLSLIATLLPLLFVLAVPTTAAMLTPAIWEQQRSLFLPALRLLAAIIAGTIMAKHPNLRILEALPLGLLALAWPLPLNRHIPLQLLSLWTSVEQGLAQFVVGFIVPTAVIYVVERRMRRRFMLQVLQRSGRGGHGQGRQQQQQQQ